ncbi:hypothetical protein KR093_010462, partial [Drosophila rubida]
WFNKVCTQCREQFPSSNLDDHSYDQIGKSPEKLITAEECYTSMKRSAESDSESVGNFIQDDIWWKIPMVLLICGAILILLMSFCFLCQKFSEKIQGQVSHRVDIEVCERER